MSTDTGLIVELVIVLGLYLVAIAFTLYEMHKHV